MSNIIARFMEPTGLEFHDVAYKIDAEIWNFIKHELKRKTKEQEGNLPIRYWQTHAVPIHQECWAMIGSITDAMSIWPIDREQLDKQKGYFQDAINHNERLFQYLRLLYNEIPGIDLNKLSVALELMDTESKLLRGAMNKARVKGTG